MDIWLLLAVVAWGIGALEHVLGIGGRINWTNAGLCLVTLSLVV